VKTVWRVICKAIQIISYPFILLIWLWWFICGTIVDFAAYLDDSTHLEKSEIKRRKTDRSNKLAHDSLDFLKDVSVKIFIGG